MKTPHLLIIGGGINGAAIARDAARRGLQVSLIEKHDFACGTSRASSKLIHGGLRYLQYFRLGLVRSSLRERNWLLRTYPHNSCWMDFIIPVYAHSPFSRWQLSMGLHLYRMLDPSGHHFRRLDVSSLREQQPQIDHQQLMGAFVYQDGHCPFPERLVIDNLRDAVDHGASIHNYREAVSIAIVRKKIEAVVIRDNLAGSESEIRPDYVVNASGPWIDRLIFPTILPRQLSRSVKGSHLVFGREGRPISQAVYAPARSDGRPFFVIPWLNFILVGTTEFEFHGDPDSVRPSSEEVDYLIAELRSYFPEISWNYDDILFSFAGIRSLMSDEAQKPGSISREVVIRDHGPDGCRNLLTLVGGKLTTFRETARQVVDFIVDSQQWKTTRCTTDDALVNCSGSTSAVNPPRPILDRLLLLYGNRYTEVLECAREDHSLISPLSYGEPDIGAQIVYAVKREWACRLEDVMLRRTSAVWNANLGSESAVGAATIMQKLLGWSEAKREQELVNYQTVVRQCLLGHRTPA